MSYPEESSSFEGDIYDQQEKLIELDQLIINTYKTKIKIMERQIKVLADIARKNAL